ncbi:MAG TPA: carboxypeptidase regulatory-like domain-containing protein [Aurantimonas coralicida]|uniref:Carboxypeptidase regulatory-like domain-containing protein n=2 Tax=root TaxID=1 RepID=A0A9C9NJL7_9HYPH|nr:carboxypeptidase regulatory-like domain-containing protein [Aurantimonas coralicida]HEU02937.1 carboxypeptidase regulatory-like domain-containing protein [Aurantimonas coralicida]
MLLDSFSGIIRSTNTPLALAALSILVIGSILYANIKGKEQTNLIKYGFGLSAIFGILSITGFFIDSYTNQIFLAEGKVVGEDNNPIESAYIDMFGSGRGVSLQDGSYKIPIYRKLSLPSYNIRVQKPGYVDWVKNDVKGPYPAYLLPVMKSKVFSAGNISIISDMTVGIYLGVPELFINFSVVNDTVDVKTLQGMIIRLNSPSGESVKLYATQIIDPSGARQFSPVTIGPLQELNLQIVFMDWPVMQAAVNAADQSGILGRYGCFPGDDTSVIADNKELEEFFDRNFRWEEGSWQARLNLTSQKNTFLKSLKFNISKSDIEGFFAMRSSYKQCAGLLFANHYVSNGAMRSMSVISIDEPN